MSVRVLFFSVLRDLVGAEELALSLDVTAPRVADAVATLYARYPDLEKWDESLLVAVNCEYADREHLLQEGDEVAFMPPVQGG